LGIRVLSIRMTCPHHRSCAVCRSASIPLMLHILSTVVLGTMFLPLDVCYFSETPQVKLI